jgi:enoyl-CoA hydratase
MTWLSAAPREAFDAGDGREGASHMAEYQSLLVSEEDGIAKIVVNRPDKLNALSRAVLGDLLRAVRAVSESTTARVAIVTGAGEKAFVAGADIAEMEKMTAAQAKTFSDAGHAVCAHIEQAACPFIAAVNGFALGGGCELALACDFIYASDKARFGQPEVNLGILPGFGGTQRLARRVGAGRARELVYTGDHVTADAALAMGLVNAVVPAAELSDRVLAVARKIAQKGPLAIAASKRVLLRGPETDLTAACELEATAFSALFGSEDQKEGMRAFLEKRAAAFKGV